MMKDKKYVRIEFNVWKVDESDWDSTEYRALIKNVSDAVYDLGATMDGAFYLMRDNEDEHECDLDESEETDEDE